MKWILRYLRWTSHVGLVYDKSSDISKEIVGYVDFDYVGDLNRRRSLIGYVFILCGSVISWKATLQSTIALSTIKVEYMVVTKTWYMVTIEAVKEAIWFKALVGNLGLQQELTLVYCDRQSVIHLTKNQMFRDVILHCIRDVIA